MIKRILFIAPAIKLSGGISKWVDSILSYSELFKDKYEIHFIESTIRNQMLPQSFRDKFTHLLISIYIYIYLLFKVVVCLNRHDFDILHISSSASLGLVRDFLLITLAKKRKRSIKAIVHFHFGRIQSIYRTKNWEKWLLNKVILLADAVIVLDNKSYNTLRENGYSNVYLIENPISDHLLKLAANTKLQRKSNHLVYVGQMLKTKGIYELIAACKDIEGIELHMYGECSDFVKDNIYRIVDKNNTWLFLHGKIEHNEVMEKFLESSLMLLPSYSEGFPNVILEAMAAKCPIIATPVGAIPEIFDWGTSEECGICVPVGTIEELKNAIVFVLKTPAFASQMADRAYLKLHSNYVLPVVWKKMTDLWTQI